MPKTKKILKNDDLLGESVKKTILELTVVSSENDGNAIESIEGLFLKHQAVALEKKDWGSKIFSRVIRKQPQGHYFFFLIDIPIRNLLAFEKDLVTKEGILRYFIVKSVPSLKSPAQKKAKKGQREVKV